MPDMRRARPRMPRSRRLILMWRRLPWPRSPAVLWATPVRPDRQRARAAAVVKPRSPACAAGRGAILAPFGKSCSPMPDARRPLALAKEALASLDALRDALTGLLTALEGGVQGPLQGAPGARLTAPEHRRGSRRTRSFAPSSWPGLIA